MKKCFRMSRRSSLKKSIRGRSPSKRNLKRKWPRVSKMPKIRKMAQMKIKIEQG